MNYIFMLLATLLLAPLVTTHAAAENTVPVNPTVIMFHKWDMQRAAAAVDKVAALGETRVQFCITLVSELNAQYEPQNFGLLRESRDGTKGNALYPMDAALRSEVKGWLVGAFQRAAAHHLKVSVLLHLNAHGPIQEWRNHFLFDPLAPIAGSSYEDALVVPVMEALEETMPEDAPVQISLQGEMGSTVFAHPQSWQAIIDHARKRGKMKRAEFGLSFNHEAVSGQVRPNEAARAALSQLWGKCDFIAISMYQQLSSPPCADDITFNVGRFVGEFFGLGCPLPETKPLHFVEFGIGGGGRSADGNTGIPALTAAAALRAPYLGTSKPEENPWTSPSMIEARRQTYDALSDFLERPMSRHPVRSVSLWSFGSWDVHGITSPAFADETIVKRLQK